MTVDVIRFESVTKRFGDVVAVDGVSFRLAPGRVLGLLGHNGAGKTTIVRILAGLIHADEGDISLWGHDPSTEGRVVRRRLGVLPGSPVVDLRLTAAENMRFAARVFDLDDAVAVPRSAELLQQFGLAERVDDRVSTFSAGMKQRLSLARVLLSDPEALVLDEPTSVMDPVGARDFRVMLAEHVALQGRSIVLCTHDLAEASQLCDEILILSNGATLRQGEPAELVRSLGVSTTLRVGETESQTQTATRIGMEFDPSVSQVRTGVICAKQLELGNIPELLRRLVGAGVDVYGVEREVASLEDLYFALHPSPSGQETER